MYSDWKPVSCLTEKPQETDFPVNLLWSDIHLLTATAPPYFAEVGGLAMFWRILVSDSIFFIL